MSELNQRIDEWMKLHPREPREFGYFARVAEKFNVHPEKVRKRWRMLNAKSTNFHQTDVPKYDYTITTSVDSQVIEKTVDNKIESLEDLIRECEIDVNLYDVINYQVKAYNAWIKNKENQIESKQLYSVKATLKAKKIDSSLPMQKDVILKEIEKYVPYKGMSEAISEVRSKLSSQDERDTALEINIPDLHIGKLAWHKESGEDYDIKIAVERYKKAVIELISRVNSNKIERIILPVGNDMINVDNFENTTTAGTAVSCDSRFGKMFQAAKDLLIETIDYLSLIAPVDVIIVPGNHDTMAMFTLGEVLDAWYRNYDMVSVSNTHTPRKYYQYGSNLIMFTHGHREKLNDLGIICATEQPQLWAATKFRRVHVGHFHHSKQIKFTDVQEYPGFTVKVLNSLSSNDDWHAEKGYMSLKGAEAFLYHKEKGLLANYYYLN
jgi:hypothetical protein